MKPERNDLISQLRLELISSCRAHALADDLPSTAHFGQDLGLDSLDLVEFVARVEAKYRVPVPDDEWQKLATLDLVADYLEERL